jgi:hypothetical protein
MSSQGNHLGQRIVRTCSLTRSQKANEDEAQCCDPNIELKIYTASHVTNHFGSPLVVPTIVFFSEHIQYQTVRSSLRVAKRMYARK